LQANVLRVGKMSKSSAKEALGQGFGSALAGGVTGATIGSFSNSSSAMLAGGLAGGAIGLVADSLVKDVNYTLVTDVQITENSKKGAHRFKTRVVSTANKVNLTFATARPALQAGLVNTLVGIF
jgi:outer membrane lipoprotein SlyB